MNQASEYNYFVYGKFVGLNSGYQLVAKTGDLTNENLLNTIAEETHRFWGSYPPEQNPLAIGVFVQESNGEKYLVLAKVEAASDRRGQSVFSGTRGFNHSIYVFIPIQSLSRLQGRIFKLLSWIFQQPIPLYERYDGNQTPFAIPLLEEQISVSQEEINKIQSCFREIGDDGKSAFISALAALINGKRLLLSGSGSIGTQEFLASLLLLLPASIRNQIAIASGTIDEEDCDWAKLLIQTGANPQHRLPEDLIWLDRDRLEFTGDFHQQIFENCYINDFILPILKDNQNCLRLIEALDGIVDNTLTLEELENPQKIDKKIIVRLIPLLPSTQQERINYQYLSNLSVSEWQELIPLIDYEQGLFFAWWELINLLTHNQEKTIPVIFEVWERFSSEQQTQLLQKLTNQPALAEVLLTHGLIESCCHQLVTNQEISANNLILQDLVKELKQLSQVAIKFKLKQEWHQGWKLATYLATKQIFTNKTEQFFVLDTALSGDTSLQNLYHAFNFKLGILIPHISTDVIKQSHFYRNSSQNPEFAQLLDNLITNRDRALIALPQITHLTNLHKQQQDNIYIEFLTAWSPSPQSTRDLLANLIALGNYDCEQTVKWFEKYQPGIGEIISQLRQNPKNWNIWDILASKLYENPQESIIFLDRVVGKEFYIPVLQKYLPIVRDKENLRDTFLQSSQAWQVVTPYNLRELILKLSNQDRAILTKCLASSQRGEWIGGDLLHYLCQNWVSDKQVDRELYNLVTSPSVTKSFLNRDWLQLQSVCWELGIQLQIPSAINNLTEQEKIFLLNSGIGVVKSFTKCEQLVCLINDLQAWALGTSIQINLIKQAPLNLLSVDLVFCYLHHDIAKVILDQEQLKLVEILLQIKTRNQTESEQIINFLTDAIAHFLATENFTQLKWWRNISIEQDLYLQAFNCASQYFVNDFVQSKPYLGLQNYFQNLINISLVEESRLMQTAFWDSIPKAFNHN